MPYKRHFGSLPGQFSTDDALKVLRGAAYAGAGAALAWVGNYAASGELSANWAIALTALAGIGANFLQKWWANTARVKA